MAMFIGGKGKKSPLAGQTDCWTISRCLGQAGGCPDEKKSGSTNQSIAYNPESCSSSDAFVGPGKKGKEVEGRVS